VARAFPGSEVLGLLFGVSVSAAINLLTAAALNGVGHAMYHRVVLSGWLLLGGSVLVGWMGIIVGKKRSDALEHIGGTLTPDEQRALLYQELERAVPTIAAMALLWVGTVVCAMIALTTQLLSSGAHCGGQLISTSVVWSRGVAGGGSAGRSACRTPSLPWPASTPDALGTGGVNDNHPATRNSQISTSPR
jgi:hypothetical protein